jgi:TonB family protein
MKYQFIFGKVVLILLVLVSLLDNGFASQRKRRLVSKQVDTSHLRISYYNLENTPIVESDTISLPSVTHRVSLETPDIDWRGSWEGTVTVKAWVDSIGHVDSVRVLSSFADIFNDGTARAARKWLFKPFAINRRPSGCIAVIPFKYVASGRSLRLRVILPD